MSDYATKADVQDIVARAVDDLSEIIAALAQTMHSELADVRTEIRDIRNSVAYLSDGFHGFIARFDRMETEQAVRGDRQFQRL